MSGLILAKTTTGTALFPDIEWNRSEQRRQAGKLAIIGGNKLGFVAVATAYQEATELGVGQVRAILPMPCDRPSNDHTRHCLCAEQHFRRHQP